MTKDTTKDANRENSYEKSERSTPQELLQHSRRTFLGTASTALLGATLAGATVYAQDSKSTGSEEKGLRLAGKKAVVTGAARGIGRAIAIHLARAGADVMGIDIAGPVSSVSETEPAKKSDLDETGRLVRLEGRQFIAVVADVRNIQSLRDASAQAEKAFGTVDIVVPNAGIQTFKPLVDMEDAHWRDIIDVNLTGYANTLRAFAPPMLKRKAGSFVLVGSSQGRQGTKHGSSYSASKWGVIGLMKSAALEFAEAKVTVNTVIPGLVDTALTRNEIRWREAIAADHKTPPAHPTEKQAAEASIKQFPLGVPWLQPDDIAPVVVFLASEEGKWTTGANYDMSAGLSAHYTA